MPFSKYAATHRNHMSKTAIKLFLNELVVERKCVDTVWNGRNCRMSCLCATLLVSEFNYSSVLLHVKTEESVFRVER